MKGKYNVTLLDAGGLGDEDFEMARRDGSLDALLTGLDVEQRAETDNLVFDNFAAYIFRWLFSGGDITDPYDVGNGTTDAALATMCLLTTDTDTTYTEQSAGFWDVSTVGNSANTSSGGKRFVEDTIVSPPLVAVTAGKEEVFCKSRWLYLPSQGVSSAIRSIGTFFYFDADATGNSSQRSSISRVRLKDSAGRNITLRKTDKNVLHIEYGLFLTAV